MRKINEIILHCSATPEGRGVSVETIRKWHKARGWSDIGYHYVISLTGKIQTGRPVEKIGAHVKGHNTGTIGVCYVGGVDSNMKPKDTRTDAQKKAIVSLIKTLKQEHPTITKITGHNEYAAKACPSFTVGDRFDYLVDGSKKPQTPVSDPDTPKQPPKKVHWLVALLKMIFGRK